MSEKSLDNKRIAKNTLLLYFRMLFTMFVTLFTSRVVLNTLGVDDYGVYNVVGGIVSMFAFINGSMSSATQRYITFALGKNNMERLQIVFSTTLQIHTIIAAIIVILGETIGLWFLYNKMQIPEGRMDAAFWVLQCSIISSAIMIVSVPYNADIVAHEKMSAFAYISVLEVVLKLLIVYMLVIFKADKLILYAFLILAIQLLIRFCYSHYCNKHFPESKYKHVWDKQLFREMTSFATWSVLGNFSGVCFGQGLNILLNVFFGPVVNAARGISVQVQTAIQGFVSNFQMALNPQITKTYARGEMEDMRRLMFRSARFSFFLLFFLSLPVLFETNFILTLWLKTVPDNSVIFLQIMICTSLIYSLSNPLIIANQATGKVKKYQLVCGTILILILPLSYICLKLGFPAYSVFIVHFCMELTCMFARMIMMRPLIGVRIREYFNHVYSRVIAVILTSVIIPALAHFSIEEGIIRFLVVSALCVLTVTASVYFIGFTKNEQYFFRSKITERFKSLINNQ